MSQDRNPVCRKGERNAFCPQYRKCLDEAVRKTWAYWDCSECEYRTSRDPTMDTLNWANESIPYYPVPDDIFDDL